MKLDILAFAAHPDDAELSCSGTLMAHIAKGLTAGICDLTRGELGTRGTVETRAQEAKEASSIMGLSVRENLGLPDGYLKNEEEHILPVIAAIRKYRPDIILCNAIDDRHPDHAIAAQLVERACFLAGLSKIETKEQNQTQQPWRPRIVLHYIQDRLLQPDVIIDISAHFDRKMQAVKAFKSQFFDPESKEPATYISSPEFFENIGTRALEMGRAIGVKYGEGFTSARTLGVNSLKELL